MKTLTSPKRLNRSEFWMWAIPLLIAHVVLNAMASSGATGVGSVDTLVIIWLAVRLAGRFYDIGWPAWIGPSFMIVTMLVLPLVALGYAIASHLPSPRFLELLNGISPIVGIANLLLIIFAGSVPGRPTDPSAEAPEVSAEMGASQTATAVMPQPLQWRASRLLLIAGGSVFVCVLVVAVLGIFAARFVPTSQGQLSSAPSQQPVYQTRSNGLTKETNDFLRQLSQQPPGGPKKSVTRP